LFVSIHFSNAGVAVGVAVIWPYTQGNAKYFWASRADVFTTIQQPGNSLAVVTPSKFTQPPTAEAGACHWLSVGNIKQQLVLVNAPAVVLWQCMLCPKW
jgi:hypothetical protein